MRVSEWWCWQRSAPWRHRSAQDVGWGFVSRTPIDDDDDGGVPEYTCAAAAGRGHGVLCVVYSSCVCCRLNRRAVQAVARRAAQARLRILTRMPQWQGGPPSPAVVGALAVGLAVAKRGGVGEWVRQHDGQQPARAGLDEGGHTARQ